MGTRDRQMDGLSRDAAQARKMGLTYGKYMAQKHDAQLKEKAERERIQQEIREQRLRESRKKNNELGRPLGWDTDKGYILWLGGASDTEIARALNTSRQAVNAYRKRYWENREEGTNAESGNREKSPQDDGWAE